MRRLLLPDFSWGWAPASLCRASLPAPKLLKPRTSAEHLGFVMTAEEMEFACTIHTSYKLKIRCKKADHRLAVLQIMFLKKICIRCKILIMVLHKMAYQGLLVACLLIQMMCPFHQVTF